MFILDGIETGKWPELSARYCEEAREKGMELPRSWLSITGKALKDQRVQIQNVEEPF